MEKAGVLLSTGVLLSAAVLLPAEVLLSTPDGGKLWVLFFLTFSCGSYSWHALLSYLETMTNMLSFFLKRQRTSQVVQWFRTHMSMQGTQV